jgi:hypothetical protein
MRVGSAHRFWWFSGPTERFAGGTASVFWARRPGLEVDSLLGPAWSAVVSAMKERIFVERVGHIRGSSSSLEKLVKEKMHE